MAQKKNKSLRVLFVTHTRAMGGANHSMFQLMKELKEKYEVEPVVLYPAYPRLDNGIDAKCKTIGIPSIGVPFYWFKIYKSWKAYVKYLLNIFLFYPLALYKLRNERFDLVHSNGSVIDLGALISSRKHIKHVWHLREFGYLDFGLVSIFGVGFERWVYSKGDCFIAISKRIEEEFTKVIPAEKIKLIYNGIVPKSADMDARHGNEVTKFVMTGMVQETKNQLEAVKAIERLKVEGLQVHLDIIGGDQNSYGNAIRCYVSEHDLEREVKLWGMRDDVPQLLTGMNVGLMLSKNEAFGRVTVEYMLQNLAVIASDTGANEEIIENGVNGLIYHYGNDEELALKMKSLIENRPLMMEMAAAGKHHALERFTSYRNTEEVYKTYLELTPEGA